MQALPQLTPGRHKNKMQVRIQVQATDHPEVTPEQLAARGPSPAPASAACLPQPAIDDAPAAAPASAPSAKRRRTTTPQRSEFADMIDSFMKAHTDACHDNNPMTAGSYAIFTSQTANCGCTLCVLQSPLSAAVSSNTRLSVWFTRRFFQMEGRQVFADSSFAPAAAADAYASTSDRCPCPVSHVPVHRHLCTVIRCR